MSVGLVLSYVLARRMVRPVRALIHAAQKVSKENYSVRVPEDSGDELGMLAQTFNHMSASIEESRAEQIRSGQIAAVGRLALPSRTTCAIRWPPSWAAPRCWRSSTCRPSR